jgi:hypothetical protein
MGSRLFDYGNGGNNLSSNWIWAEFWYLYWQGWILMMFDNLWRASLEWNVDTEIQLYELCVQ